MDNRTSVAEVDKELIGSATSVEDIIIALAKRGCSDLTSSIDLGACSTDPLAGGGFCEVYQGTTKQGIKIAIKSLKIYQKSGKESEKQKTQVLMRAARELYHWSKLQHPNVIPLMGLAIFRGHMSMVSKWMDNGSLLSYIEDNPHTSRMRLCLEICLGLCYIHINGMVHGDLKAANVMVDPDGKAMIADFGNAQLKDLTMRFTDTANFSYSLRWAAPELLLADDGPAKSKEADVYAFGMTVLEALTGNHPHYGVGDKRIIGLVAYERKHPVRPATGMSDDVWELLMSCWAWEMLERPDIVAVRDRLQNLPDLPPPQTGTDYTRPVVGNATSVEDVIGILAERGCSDLSSSIDLSACGELPLAGGGFCDVYRGSTNHGIKIAIKSLRVYDRPGRDDRQSKILKQACRELYSWSKLRHPNVLPLMGLASFRGHLSMISEWMNNGSMVSYIQLNPDVNRLKLCMEVCAGMSYIHKNGMVHGDLKAANVMVSHKGTARIADFGNSCMRDFTVIFTQTTSSALSLRWAAPELLLGDPDSERRSKAADVYAYGMTVLEILTGKVPFDGYSEQKVLVLVAVQHRSPPRPGTGVSDEIWGILQACWSSEEKRRPGIESIEERLGVLHSRPPRTDKASSDSDLDHYETSDTNPPSPGFEGKTSPLQAIERQITTYRRRGQTSFAESLCIGLMDAQTQSLGENHPETLQTMAELASLCYAQGPSRMVDAERLYLNVLAARKQLLGEDHPDTIQTMADLASTYFAQGPGRLADAEAQYSAALYAQKRVLGDHHPNTLQSMCNLAEVYRAQGRDSEYATLVAEAQVMKTSQPQHPILH